MLPKKFRLPAKRFSYVYKHGIKARGQYGMLISSKNDISNPRFGFVVSKKIGNAVFRHRMTRLLRAVMMEIVKEEDLDTYPFDFQYVSFKFCDDKSSLKKEILSLFNRLNND